MKEKPAYIEFGVQSNFSFLRGASRPEELVRAAAHFEHAAMGLADRNTVAGVVRAWNQSRSVLLEDGQPPVTLAYHPGSRLVFADGTPDVLAYPRDRVGWGNLCRLLTQANMRDESEKGNPLVYRGDLLEWGDAMSLAVVFCGREPDDVCLSTLRGLRYRFGPSVWLAVAPDYRGGDRLKLARAAAVAKMADMPLLATNDVLYHVPARRPLQDIVTAIRLGRPVSEAGYALEANAERHLKPPLEMARLFRAWPDAIAQTVEFAATLSFSLDVLKHNYPEETTEEGVDPQTELERLTWAGAKVRYPEGVPERIVSALRHELALVAEKKYARYFLTVNDIVRYARSEAVGILCQGRGSAANSMVCFCLGITEVDPILMKVEPLLGRFISTERDEPPDIDVDFEHERRDEIIAYIYQKYSEKRTALAASVVTYRGRSALREVAKAMGLSNDVQSGLSSAIWGWWTESLGEDQAKAGGLDQADPVSKLVIDHANELMGFPRHLSQHVGGFVITKDRLDEIVPIVKTAMPERKMVEWDKDDLDSVAILKVDVLALGMLSCLRRAFALLADRYGRRETLASIRADQNPRVYDMICRADTLGVFQIESRAQMSMLPRLKPREFYDLVIEVAIVRPGPIQGNMVHPYLQRRLKKEEIAYQSDVMKNILQRTLGVPLFQEQAMSIAIEAGGFEPGEADQLRRAMATFRRTGAVKDYKKRMIEGMVSRNYDPVFAENCFSQIEGFGEYGFPESHAASFAILVYVSCWFKAFYPDVFCAAILNAQPMGFYQPAQLVRDAREHGIVVRPVDVNSSNWDAILEPHSFDAAEVAERHGDMRTVIKSRHAVRLGFRQVEGLSSDKMARMVSARGEGYRSVHDLWLRSGLDVGSMLGLAEADAFRSLGLDRRQALWAVRALSGPATSHASPLFDRPDCSVVDGEVHVQLPEMPPGEHVIQDYRSLKLSLKAHPVAFLRRRLDRCGVTPSDALNGIQPDRLVTVAGLVLVRQRPGKGNAIFLTLEDEAGIANIIIWVRVFERFRAAIMAGRLLRVRGRLQSESGVIHIEARSIEDLSDWLTDLSEQARQIDVLAPVDEIKRPVTDPRRTRAQFDLQTRHDASGRDPRWRSEDERVARETRAVMPKGRNFQ